MTSHCIRDHLPKTLSSELSHKPQLYSVLNQMRESMHSHGSYASRNQALDELVKLLFTHVMSLSHDGGGILSISPPEPARKLARFVQEQFQKSLPDTLRQQLGIRAMSLDIKPEQNAFAMDIIKGFEALSDPGLVDRFRGHEGVDILNETFGSFLTSAFSNEKEFGQYLTPHCVINLMVHMALDALPEDLLHDLTSQNNSGHALKILDPSCGTGSFLTECTRSLYRAILKCNGTAFARQWVRHSFGCKIFGIDKSDRMIRLALTNFAMFGAEDANLHAQNGLNLKSGNQDLTNKLRNKTALILTNPPFGASVDTASKPLTANGGSNQRGRPQRVPSELAFLEKYVDWLCPGGVVATIVPDSVLYNRGAYERIRCYLAQHMNLVASISLPPVTFAAAGTSTKTSLLLMQKHGEGVEEKDAFFGVCRDIGFKVSSRGAHRKTHVTGKSDLPEIYSAWRGRTEAGRGRWSKIDLEADRWDAHYQAGISENFHALLKRTDFTNVRDLALLVADKLNPKQMDADTFEYIEIAGVCGATNTVTSKTVRCDEAPSRARKPVRAGDVLVSTVRPERRAIGVVPPHLDGAICTTGFAVLRPLSVSPLLLAKLLQTDLANAQLRRNNVGISYPVFPEDCLKSVVLPISTMMLERLGKDADAISFAKSNLVLLEQSLAEKISDLTSV